MSVCENLLEKFVGFIFIPKMHEKMNIRLIADHAKTDAYFFNGCFYFLQNFSSVFLLHL